jgi:endonuclease/exonuclease/phosphatase family metal-dependent hydrolase
MLPIADRVVAALPVPDPALLATARASAGDRAEHDRIAAQLPALDAVEYRPPSAVPARDRRLRVIAWNAERLKYGPASAALLGALDPDLVLLSETDCGMARAGNRHTTADLATALGLGYAYGIEFVELGLGDKREQRWHAGEANAIGFHGNAILSRYPLQDIALIRLDEGGRWFGPEAGEQRRLGGRMALAAKVAGIVAVSLHLESASTPASRGTQIERLLQALQARYGAVPAVIGGDCNSDALPAGATPETWLDRVEQLEPMFAALRQAGFAWAHANDMAPTQRQRPDGFPPPPFHRIDWLFTRGVMASAPQTIAAVDQHGMAISDHEAIIAEIAQP